ncbi:MAG: DmsC/YnfH family molybdoenzyme membrane anchor subunit, partial [Bdellovibrionota bacterium]
MGTAAEETAIEAFQRRIAQEPERQPLRVVPGGEEHRPAIPLQPGENWRFHFDMSLCVGCKCCEVACHEQNNNPPDVKWRRVGEVEGGVFPDTKHFFTSIACNHCLEPTCLSGCPVDAYKKDPLTGVVLLDSSTCIGCQYCTWNCAYGAPQFNEERGVVTKCDLCHNRLKAGELPACVAACPSGAIQIEAFKPAEWRRDLSGANAPGLPDAGITVSATRITLPPALGERLQRIDDFRIKPEKAHYSLIVLTVFTQLAVGGFLSLLLMEWAGELLSFPPAFESVLKTGALVMLGAAGLALGVSIFHLGKPLFAWRALKMWRRSWLSREVLFFALFAGLAFLHAALRWFPLAPPPLRGAIGALVALSGLAGVYASACIYRVPARPSWNTPRTQAAF